MLSRRRGMTGVGRGVAECAGYRFTAAAAAGAGAPACFPAPHGCKAQMDGTGTHPAQSITTMRCAVLSILLAAALAQHENHAAMNMPSAPAPAEAPFCVVSVLDRGADPPAVSTCRRAAGAPLLPRCGWRPEAQAVGAPD